MPRPMWIAAGAALPLVALAVAALGQSPGQGVNRPALAPTDPIVSLSRSVESLQAQVSQLQAEVKRLEAHTHNYSHSMTPVNYWMSIGQLRDAMQPHSNVDITINWIPIQSTDKIPVLSRALTSVTGPPRSN